LTKPGHVSETAAHIRQTTLPSDAADPAHAACRRRRPNNGRARTSREKRKEDSPRAACDVAFTDDSNVSVNGPSEGPENHPGPSAAGAELRFPSLLTCDFFCVVERYVQKAQVSPVSKQNKSDSDRTTRGQDCHSSLNEASPFLTNFSVRWAIPVYCFFLFLSGSSPCLHLLPVL